MSSSSSADDDLHQLPTYDDAAAEAEAALLLALDNDGNNNNGNDHFGDASGVGVLQSLLRMASLSALGGGLTTPPPPPPTSISLIRIPLDTDRRGILHTHAIVTDTDCAIPMPVTAPSLFGVSLGSGRGIGLEVMSLEDAVQVFPSLLRRQRGEDTVIPVIRPHRSIGAYTNTDLHDVGDATTRRFADEFPELAKTDFSSSRDADAPTSMLLQEALDEYLRLALARIHNDIRSRPSVEDSRLVDLDRAIASIGDANHRARMVKGIDLDVIIRDDGESFAVVTRNIYDDDLDTEKRGGGSWRDDTSRGKRQMMPPFREHTINESRSAVDHYSEFPLVEATGRVASSTHKWTLVNESRGEELVLEIPHLSCLRSHNVDSAFNDGAKNGTVPLPEAIHLALKSLESQARARFEDARDQYYRRLREGNLTGADEKREREKVDVVWDDVVRIGSAAAAFKKYIENPAAMRHPTPDVKNKNNDAAGYNGTGAMHSAGQYSSNASSVTANANSSNNVSGGGSWLGIFGGMTFEADQDPSSSSAVRGQPSRIDGMKVPVSEVAPMRPAPKLPPVYSCKTNTL